jgi:hypothetical protein
MIFAPPMWRKAGRGAARARVSPRARRRGGVFGAGRIHQYRRRRQFKFYRAGKGANCLRHRTGQRVARRFDVEAARRPLRPGRRDCFQRQGRWRGFERASRAPLFRHRRNRSTATISWAMPSRVSRPKTRRRRSPPSPRPASLACCRCCRRAPRLRLFAEAARAKKPWCGNWRPLPGPFGGNFRLVERRHGSPCLRLSRGAAGEKSADYVSDDHGGR